MDLLNQDIKLFLLHILLVAEAVEDINNNSDEEATKCAICLEDVTNRAQPNACIHNFCYDCIREWSQVKPECPLCKIRFRVIRHNFRSENDYDDFVVPPPPARIPVHYAGIIPDLGHDINDDFDDEFGVPMVFEAIDADGRYRFVYPASASRTAHRTPRGDWFLNRLLDGTPNSVGYFPIHRHHPQSQPIVPAQHVPIATTILPSGGQVTLTRVEAAPFAHHHIPAASDAHSNSANRSTIPHHGAEFRRSIYDHNQWVRMRPGTIFPSPEYFRSDPTVIARVTPWLQREVFALLGLSHAESHVSHVSQVLNAILSYVYRVDIRSREFRHAVSNYFGTRTAHFQHEFYNFVLSGMRLDEYDCHANYAVQPPRPASHRNSPPQVNHTAPETVINVSIRTEREVPARNNAALQEHNYATPSPTSTNVERMNVRAINNDHDYMNTNSHAPTMSASDLMRHGVILPTHVQRLALRNHLLASGRVNDPQDQGPQGRSECGRENSRMHHHHHHHHSLFQPHGVCHGPRPMHLARPSSTGNPSDNIRHSCNCANRDFRQPAPMFRPRTTPHICEPIFGHGIRTPANQTLPTSNCQSRTPSGPGNQEDIYGVMYAPIGVRMVSPHHRPSVLLLDSENGRNGSQPYTASARYHHLHHHHHRPVDFPLSHPLVDYPISHPLVDYPINHSIVDYAINHSSSAEYPINIPSEHPLNRPAPERPPTSEYSMGLPCEHSLNRPGTDRPTPVDYPISLASEQHPLNRSTSERPLNLPVVERQLNLPAAERTANHSTIDRPMNLPSVENSSGHTDVDRPFNVEFPPSPPAYRVHPERPLTLEDFPILSVRRNVNERERESRSANRRPECQPPQSTSPVRGESATERTPRLWYSPPQNSYHGRTEFSQALRDRLVTRMMFQTNERREQSARQPNPGFGVRIEVFPTGTTETTTSPSPSFYTQPTYTSCGAIYSNSASYPHLRERGSVNETLNTLNAVTRTPSPRSRDRPSSDDDDCQVVAVQPTPKKPPLDIITLSSDDESLEEIPFARLEDPEDNRNAEREKELADQPGPSSRLRHRHRLWPQNSRDRANRIAEYSALLARFQAKKMRLENSPSQAVPSSSSLENSSSTGSSSSTLNSFLKNDAQIQMLQQLEADTTRLERNKLIALGIQSSSSNSDNVCAVPSSVAEDDDADASSEFSDSDNTSQDGVTSSTTAAAAALVGLRYSKPTVNESDFIKNESIRRSSVIRHTNLAGSSRSFVNATQPSKQEKVETTKASPDHCSRMKSEMPGTSYQRNAENFVTSRNDDSDSDIEILFKNEVREETSAHNNQAMEAKRENENSDESEDEEVTELTRLTESENDDVVEIPGVMEVHGPYRVSTVVSPNDLYLRSMYNDPGRDPYESEGVVMNYSLAAQQGNRENGEQDYVVIRDTPSPDTEDNDRESCVPISHGGRDWL